MTFTPMMELRKKSIADERVRNFIFDGINTSDNSGEVSKAFFVTYNARR